MRSTRCLLFIFIGIIGYTQGGEENLLRLSANDDQLNLEDEFLLMNWDEPEVDEWSGHVINPQENAQVFLRKLAEQHNLKFEHNIEKRSVDETLYEGSGHDEDTKNDNKEENKEITQKKDPTEEKVAEKIAKVEATQIPTARSTTSEKMQSKPTLLPTEISNGKEKSLDTALDKDKGSATKTSGTAEINTTKPPPTPAKTTENASVANAVQTSGNGQNNTTEPPTQPTQSNIVAAEQTNQSIASKTSTEKATVQPPTEENSDQQVSNATTKSSLIVPSIPLGKPLLGSDKSDNKLGKPMGANEENKEQPTKRPRNFGAIETLEKEQSGLAILNNDVKTMEGSEAVLVSMQPAESIKAASQDEPQPSESSESTGAARTDSKLLISLGVAVLTVGVAAFTYNYIKKQRRSQNANENVQNGGSTLNDDPEAGRELKPLMNNGDKTVGTEDSRIEIADK